MPNSVGSNLSEVMNEKSTEKKKEFKVKYIGESSRSLYERSIEHMNDYQSLSERSHMLKHYLTAHRDMDRDQVRFGIRVRNQYKKAFERQIGEAISIEQEMLKKTTLLNSKSEFNRCTVPRLTMTTYKETEEEIEKEEREKKILKEEIRKLKKRKKENEADLKNVCDELCRENYVPWKKRRIEEEKRWEENQKLEEEMLERTRRKK